MVRVCTKECTWECVYGRVCMGECVNDGCEWCVWTIVRGESAYGRECVSVCEQYPLEMYDSAYERVCGCVCVGV